MIIRKLTVFLLALCVATLIAALCLNDWHCGSLFEHCTAEGAEDRDAMLAVMTMLVIGVVFIFIVFLLDVVLLCRKTTATGLITARFVFIYLGAALAFIAVIVYTAIKSNMWGYFLAVFASTISIVLAMMAVVSSRCVSQSEVVTVHHN
ncbi:unnamed protein product [Hydatigera taeniaeformis]|uniref:Expressed conserved protein n=1 Tax=Hydatigena taeniaeformis TaxID=6205 RepID=A0A0R3WKI8_HYDTA|nr:unnamed protein product [Hydatigera taeniaeformis]